MMLAMTVKDFMNNNVWAQWGVSIFKGISPTLIALLTIYLNSRRERKKNKKDTLCKYVDDITDSILELIDQLWGTLICANTCMRSMKTTEKCSKEIILMFDMSRKVVISSRTIKQRTEIYSEIIKLKEFNYSTQDKSVQLSIDNLSKIVTDLSKKLSSISDEDLKKQYDEKFDQCYDMVEKTEEQLKAYCIQLNSLCKTMS